MKLDLLAIAPHPDDVELTCGGTMIRMAQAGYKTGILDLTKGETVRRGLNLGVDYARTHSCYDPTPTGEACGHCDSCLLRLRAFAENDLTDPAPYQALAA